MSKRKYVKVLTCYREDGLMIPVQIWWEDGQKYKIERVKGPVPAAAQKCGGCGDRYTIYIEGKERYLYFERSSELVGNHLGRWFVEVDD